MPHRDRLPVLAISLTSAIDRRATLKASLDKLGIAFQFLDAIDGRQKLPAEFSRSFDPVLMGRRLGRRLTDAEIATALSHQAAYRWLLDSQHSHAMILEDDAICRPEVTDFRRDGVQDAAPLVLLTHTNARIMPGKRRSFGAHITLCELAVPCFCATAYTVSREAAAYLLEANTPVTAPADWPGDITKLGAMVAVPTLVDHPPITFEQSQISASGRRKAKAPLSRLARPAYIRRIWRKARSERIS